MSGGYWNYNNDGVADVIFNMYPDYGKDGFSRSAEARKRDPLDDPELSEMVWDMFCLLHSADWYFSADTGEDTYRKDVKYFKDKWFQSPEKRVAREIESAITHAREDLYKTFGKDVSKLRDSFRVDIKYFDPDIERIQKISVGDWIDLRAAERVTMKKGDYALIPLGVGMILPDGYEAHVMPRSSTLKNFGILMACSGIIDNSYSGDSDQWLFGALAIRDTIIEKGDRICQFRIMENQPRLIFREVAHLNDVSRGGIGSTGKR